MKFKFYYRIKNRRNEYEKILFLDKNMGYDFIERCCYGKGEKKKFIIKDESKYKISKYIAIDNSQNKCIIGEFKTLDVCKKFLLEDLTYNKVIYWEIKKLKRLERLFYLKYYITIFFLFIISFLFSNYIVSR
ncbi:hypothetical protein LI058_15960 [Clostridium perfringens]|uniref:hypothetical protein n=1 Tax=Clostridium perfringens TaxID=1502 RepID=UPI0022450D5A|nr:hypothetical protein [Clostridium perfringens]MCX0365527.1 hypothetical protein [Clostridium perfringens]MCX0374963.1 hypothetical protein [Clostridium perfringens]MCX0395755.1 hypothetical protein [Clostridium perfringens]MCX0402230.1 hypothetical protein [Clostridium perfringens]